MISLASPQPAKSARSTPSPRPSTPRQRKKPHCKQCGKPMQGHRRSQCDTDTETETEEEEDEAEEDVDNAVVARLSKVEIKDANVKDTKTVRFKTEQVSGALAHAVVSVPDELMSLASADKAVLQALAKPGMLTDEVDSKEGKEKMDRLGCWLDNIESSKRGRKGRPSAPLALPSRGVFDAILEIKERPRSVSPQKRDVHGAMGLKKTLSIAEREEFLNELAIKSKKDVTNTYRVNLDELQELESRAKVLKLHARAIAPKYADGSTDPGWLVIGKDKADVENKFKCLEKELRGSSKLASTLGTLATGAVACWMYLAFS